MKNAKVMEAQLMEAFFLKLSHYCQIGDEERDAILNLPARIRDFSAGSDVVVRGEEPNEALIIKSGWAARYTTLRDGRTQILNFLMPGDFFDLQVFIADEADHSVTAITPLSVFSTPGEALLNVFVSNHKIGMALWWAALQEEAILREQIVRNGRRDAAERTAHLLLELHRRALMIGAAREDAFRLPVSQVLIADALGLSFVHVNRVLRKFINNGLIGREKDVIILKNREGLIDLCDFSEDYLHLDAGPLRHKLDPGAFTLASIGRRLNPG